MSSREILIRPRISLPTYLAETWRYRQIAVFLAWRDVLVRFKQTVIGVLWVVLRPLAGALVFSFVFSRIAGLTGEGVPYLLFVMVAMLPWQFFSAVVGQAAESVTANAGMVTKIYFPRILLPIAVVLGMSVDFVVSLPVLAVMMIYFGVAPPLTALWAFPILALVVMAAFGVGAILAALNACYRDIRHAVPFLVQLGLFISPIGYGTGSIPTSIRAYYCVNPLVGLLEALRSTVLGIPLAVPSWAIVWSVACCITTALLGLIVFARREATFVDLV